MNALPILYVEGKDDVSVISNLLSKHGLDTKRGAQHLVIKDLGSVAAVVDAIPDAARANTDRPVGFVVDIDIELTRRWTIVSGKLREIGIVPPAQCGPDGFVFTLPGYRCPFGVWLMPDCVTDYAKLEHLIESLIQLDNPLWPFAKECVKKAAMVADLANADRGTEICRRFRDVDIIKAEIHTWLAWQIRPGVPFGGAINDQILGCDSHQAMAFLRWMEVLFEFPLISTDGKSKME
jgi:hypothetical protein